MPFSPQPRKKGVLKPQAGSTPACGHTTSQKNCAECSKQARKPVVDLATQKQRALALRDKLTETISRDSKLAEKAALILSQWINSKK